MQPIARILASALIVIATSLGAFALVGCGGSGSQSAQASASAQSAEVSAEASDASSENAEDNQASSDAEDDEQDNCYGDDLPAKKS